MPRRKSARYRCQYDTPWEQLLANSKVDPVTGCRLWLRATNGNGYPRVGYKPDKDKPNVSVAAHRLSLTIKLGRPIRPGYEAAHVCPAGPNKLCIEPTHLEEQTRVVNLKARKPPRKPVYEKLEKLALAHLASIALE